MNPGIIYEINGEIYGQELPPCAKMEANWVLIDTLGRQLSNIRFDYPAQLTDTFTVVSQNGRAGLLNTYTLKWTILPKYQSLKPLGGRAYLATTCSGKMGILHATGKSFADTVYTSGKKVFSDSYVENCAPCLNTKEVWLMESKSGSVLYGTSGALFKETNAAQITLRMMDYLLNDLPGVTNYAQPILRFHIADSLKPNLHSSPFRKLLFDYLMANKEAHNNKYITTQLSHITPFSFVIKSQIIKSSYTEGMMPSSYAQEILKWRNFIYEDGALKELQCEQLFDSPSDFYAEFLMATQDSTMLNFDWSGTEEMADFGGQDKELSYEGIKVWFCNPDQPYYPRYQSVTIPWERVALQRAGAKIAEKYLH